MTVSLEMHAILSSGAVQQCGECVKLTLIVMNIRQTIEIQFIIILEESDIYVISQPQVMFYAQHNM